MSRFLTYLKERIGKLNTSIYVGERYEKNLSALVLLGVLTGGFGFVMTILNLVQRKGFVTLTTLLFFLSGACAAYMAKFRRKREPAVLLVVVDSLIFFTYYAVGGVNEGFAILWTLLMPLVVCYFLSVKYGILLSVYFEALMIVLFWTPLRQHFSLLYTETFMNRFPILYLCGLMITAVSMSQYHESVLTEIEYLERLNSEVEKQTRFANERADKLGRLSEQMVETLARTIDAKDRYTNGHSFRVSVYAVALAVELGWDEKQLAALRREALLHDIGKIGVPDAVLNKPGRLTDEEFRTIQSHTTIGRSILSGLEDMEEAAEVANYHHERYDGKGYPAGLAGTEIPLKARIVTIADSYDAMHSDRIYRPALPDDVIRRELEKGRGVQFDPECLDAFLRLLDGGFPYNLKE